ncbi:DUF134 domain-containing protein [Candidatus Woesearchaeota archaeon]|nr:DUF134 domain-containing protein [Candidatus Woesearchaeota archaeon]
MPRPRKRRNIRYNPSITYYKPRGVPLKELQEVTLTIEELEALRLKNVEDKDQTTAAQSMNISQSTFHRILLSAYKKIANALVTGKAIKITTPPSEIIK